MGVLTPAIVRPREGGGYEIVAGRRRKRACELAGLDTMPAIVRELDRDTAIIMMVDNQKIKLTPAYRLAALKPEEQALLVETIHLPCLLQLQRPRKCRK